MLCPPPIDRSDTGLMSGHDTLDFERGVSAGWGASERRTPIDNDWPDTYRKGWLIGWEAHERAEAQLEKAWDEAQGV